MEIKEHDRKVITHTPVCSIMRCVKPSYAGLRSGTHLIIHKSVSSSFRMLVKAVHMFLNICCVKDFHPIKGITNIASSELAYLLASVRRDTAAVSWVASFSANN